MTDEAPQFGHLAGQKSSEKGLSQTYGQDFEIDVMEMLRTLKNKRRRILAIAIAFSFAAIVIAFLIPAQYTSQASFIPPSNSGSSSAAAALAGQLSSLGSGSLLGGVKSSGDLYAGILRSRSISHKLIERFHLKDVYGVNRESVAVRKLASNTTISVGTKDSIITIEVKDKSPKRAQELANAYLDALWETNGRLAISEASQRRIFFDQQLSQEKNALADAEVQLKKSQESSGLIAPSGQTALQIQTIARTKAEIASREIELSNLRQSSTAQNPAVIRLRAVIADLEGQLARLQSGGGNQGIGDIPASKVPAIELLYVRRAREVKYHEALFEMIAKQDEAARMDEAREAPLLQVLDPASYPDQKSWPPRTLFIICGFILGLLCGSSWFLALQYKNTVRTIFLKG